MLQHLVWMMAGEDGSAPSIGLLWNPASKSSANWVLSNGNRTANANTSNHESGMTTRNDFDATGSGKYYWEALIDIKDASGDIFIGLRRTDHQTSTAETPVGSGTYCLWRDSGVRFTNGGWTQNTTVVSYTVGDVLMFALDEAAGKFFTGKNGTWNGSGDPAAGTNATFTTMPGSNHAFYASTDNSAGEVQITLQSTLTYTVPTGFTAI